MKTTENKTEVKTISKTSGIPMSEKEYEEWKNAFLEIEEISRKLK